MPSTLPHLLALLIMALGAAVIAYVVARRPREPSTWALAGAAAGVLGIYLSEYFLYRPGLTINEGYFWQKAMSVGAGVASIGAVALALTLRETPVPRWERALAGALILRALLDMFYIVTLVPSPQTDRLGSWGTPLLNSGSAHLVDAGLALLSVPLAIVLFYRTFCLASNARRRVFIAYLLPAFLLICLGSTISMLWGLRAQGPLFPTGVVVAPAAAFAAAGLLHLEARPQLGVRLPAHIPLLLAWAGLMVLAFIIDLRWLRGQTPLAALFTLIGGLATGLAYLARRADQPQAAAEMILPSAEEHAGAASAALVESQDEPQTPVAPGETTRADRVGKGPRMRIHLFGPFLVERDGEPLPNHAKLWHSDKSRSLLAYLALAGEKGLTRGQLVDALWPLPDDGDGGSEQRSINSLYSSLSILRKVLEPDRPPAAESVIAHDGDRYRLVSHSDVWVDAHEFAQSAAEAERLAATGHLSGAAAAWEQAVALHGELGLLPDEAHLPLEAVEPERERLRQGWLRGVRWLARYYSTRGPVERAVMLWEMAWRAAPLHAEAYSWLVAHYRRTGQSAQLTALEEARRRAEAELGE